MARMVCEFAYGDKVIDLVNSNRFRLAPGWVPKVALRSNSRVGGKSPFLPVVEDMPIWVYGLDATDTIDAIDEILQMADRARDYALHETGDPVVFRWRSAESDYLEPLSCLVTDINARELVALTDEYHKKITAGATTIELSFTRRGEWLFPGISQTLAGSTGYWTSPVTINNWPQSLAPAPISLRIAAGTTPSPATFYLNGFVALQSEASLNQLLTPTSGTGSNIATTGSSSGNVYRFAASGTANFTAVTNANERHFLVFAKLKNNSASTAWQIYLKALYLGDQTMARTSTYVVPAGTSIRTVFIGELITPRQLTDMQLVVTAGATSLDIDSLLIVAVDSDTRVLGVEMSQVAAAALASKSFTVNANPFGAAPAVEFSGWDNPPVVNGDLWLSQKGKSLKIASFLGGGNGNTYFNPYGSGAMSLCVPTITRWQAVLGGV